MRTSTANISEKQLSPTKKLEIVVAERTRAEERYRTLYETSRDAIMTLSPPSWNFTAGNPATVTLFAAKSEAEFISKRPWQLSPEFQPDGQPSSKKAKLMIDTAMRKGSHFFDWVHRRINGEDFPATVLLTRVTLGDETFLQATVRDVTRLKRAEEELRKDKALLEQKNVALMELLGQIEMAKTKTKEDIAINVEKIIMPTLKKLELKGVPQKELKIVYHQLGQLVSSFGRRVTDRKASLSPREIELCDLVRQGLTSKEISGLLDISYKTIDKHRRNIRRKFGISKKKVNLTSFLKSCDPQ